MALHDYTDEVLGSKASIRVLKTMLKYRGKVFTIRELSRTAQVSHPEVSRVVKALQGRGVVRLQPVGRAQQVSLNVESYILRSVLEPMFRAEARTVSSLVAAIRPFFSDRATTSVAIYGSVVRGRERNIGDVDLLIISGDRERANEGAAKASIVALSKFGIGLSPMIMSEIKFVRESRKGFGRSVLESYVLVAGKDLKELVENVKASR